MAGLKTRLFYALYGGGYMISFLRELAALPLKLLFWICHFLRLPYKIKTTAMIWKVGREPLWLNTWIVLVCQHEGMDKARAACRAASGPTQRRPHRTLYRKPGADVSKRPCRR